MWQISHFTKCTKNFNSAFKNLPQASANNLEMHKLFIKAAAQNTVLPPPPPRELSWISALHLCYLYCSSEALHGGGSGRGRGVFLHGSPES